MDNCPVCNHRSLVYEPRTKNARCLRLECGYVKEMSYIEYSKEFELADKNLVQKLSLHPNGKLVIT